MLYMYFIHVPEFLYFFLEKYIFFSFKYFVDKKTGCILIQFDLIFRVKLLEFTKSRNFGSNSKKKLKT